MRGMSIMSGMKGMLFKIGKPTDFGWPRGKIFMVITPDGCHAMRCKAYAWPFNQDGNSNADYVQQINPLLKKKEWLGSIPTDHELMSEV